MPAVADFFSRLAQIPGEVYRRVVPQSPYAVAAERNRQLLGFRSAYELRDLLLSGNVYLPYAKGGALKDVLRMLGRAQNATAQDEAKYPVTAYFNPVPRIVAFYANALGGRLGEDLEPETPDGGELDTSVSDALSRLWRWSNLDTRLGEVTALAANQGTVGIRIVADAGRVSLDWDHPEFIQDVAEDNRGNVVGVHLKYDVVRPDGRGGQETVGAEEWITKEGFSRVIDGKETLTPQRRENRLGICPYVLLRHARKAGSVMGVHAYEGSELPIHGINYLLSQTGESINAHVWPYLYATGAGQKPQKFMSGRYTLIYQQNQPGVPPGTFDPMVPSLPFAEAGQYVDQLAAYVGDRQPETALEWLRVYANLSGETLQQALKRAESACLSARVQYEDAMVRALQIGLSEGIELGLWDLGTGQDADAAYDDGQGPEAFRFKARSALPLTPAARLANVEADTKEWAFQAAKEAADEPDDVAGTLPDEPPPDEGPDAEADAEATDDAGELAAA